MVRLDINKQPKDKNIKIRRKGNSYEARKTIDLSKIYGFEMTKRISKTALTKEEAIRLLKVKEQEEILKSADEVKTNKYKNKLEYEQLQNVTYTKETDFTLKTFVNQMLMDKKLQSETNMYNRRRKISPKTVTSYLGTANRQVIPTWGDLDIRDITTEQLQRHFDTLDYSQKYLKDIKLILRLTFQTAINMGIIKENPATNIYIGERKYNRKR